MHAAAGIHAAPASCTVAKRALAERNFGGRGAGPGSVHVAFADGTSIHRYGFARGLAGCHRGGFPPAPCINFSDVARLNRG